MTNRPHKPAVWDKFLEAVEAGNDLHASCKIAGIAYVTQWLHRKNHPDFAKRFDEAYEAGRANMLAAMEAEADRRGITGTLKPVFQGGKKVGAIREYSDTLLIFRMKKLDPSYRDRATAEINNSGGGQIHVHITPDDEKL